MTLGERIKNQRTRAGLSQERVAELVGVSRQSVTKWESGQSAPSTENLFRLAEIFGTTVDMLLDIPDEKNSQSTDQAQIKELTSQNLHKSPASTVVSFQDEATLTFSNR